MVEYLYEKIATAIDKDIKSGVYGVHQKLPSENDLAQQFQTTRLTIRKAIDKLEKQHVAVRDRNRGTYVLAAHDKISSGADGLVGFTEAAKKFQLNVSTKILDLNLMTEYPNYIQDKLDLMDNEPVWQISRLRFADHEPMTHEQIYIKQRILPELTIDEAEGSLYQLIEQTMVIGYADQELEAVLLDQDLSRLLATSTGSPAFFAHTTAYSVDGYPILYDDSHYRADKYTFHNILYRKH
ncbi:GntR family transcriptional regulator, LSA1692 subfamily [Lapidilactobacillus bayanensis]|uniref:GntR family transcriptional regulator, LSA1692 subfamily n=1 Tax=Lapidilactobacillus bayanensis TaxID=2485998 RepID=UPI000F774AD3|nr:GntR family transcriptional regulator, LSA1692 subfamily [Lapidilactobacillus bayanensis]